MAGVLTESVWPCFVSFFSGILFLFAMAGPACLSAPCLLFVNLFCSLFLSLPFFALLWLVLKICWCLCFLAQGAERKNKDESRSADRRMAKIMKAHTGRLFMYS